MNLAPRQSLEGVTPLGVSYTSFIKRLARGQGPLRRALCLHAVSTLVFEAPRRLFWDDAFASFAFVLVLITAAIWQWGAGDMYHVLNVQAGVEPYDEEQFLPRMRQWLLASLVAMVLFYTSLVSIKLAFLFFFRRLGASIQRFRRVWWPVLGVSLGSYIVAVGNLRYQCLVGPVETVLEECNEAPSVSFETTTLKANCVLDVLTDFMTSQVSDPHDSVCAYTMEAIAVSCLSAFPQLFGSSRSRKPAFTPSESFLKRMSRIRSKRNLGQERDTLADMVFMAQPTALANARIDPENPPQTIQDCRQTVLLPKVYDPVVYSFKGAPRDPSLEDGDQIQPRVEFTVTK
ncbi:hypothetical protein PG993_012540 [Apiospora rasikravindrae]|uniref:Rhodopsin domain-containing protein n=1 Tax=Apiospora rasikravindrae TaxID=990691 RepID=A0ABR1S2Q1_9PEZI